MLIKICPDPHCDTIYHNCTEKDKKCKNCGGTIKMINEKTFFKKYINHFWQLDYKTENFYRLQPNYKQLELF
jgi:hypothetical protein